MPAPPVSTSLDLDAPAQQAPPPPPPQTAVPPVAAPEVSTSLDLDAPVSPVAPAAAPPVSTSLDLGASPPAPPATPAATSLDLGTPTPAPAATTPSPQASTSLDLDAPAGMSQTSAPRTSRHTLPPAHDLQLPTIGSDERRILTDREPVVHLTRLQSGAGSLEVRVAVATSSEVALGLVFETGDRRESVVLPGLSQQGPDPRSPIFRATTSGAAINLRRITDVHRFLLFAVPTRPSKQMPGGTVTLTTYAGARLELPLVAGPTFGAQALLTGHVVEGRIVIRAEHDPYSGTLQQICGAYGYTELSWRDAFTPLV